MWEAVFKCYWQVSVFQETPENTPYSPFLLFTGSLLFFLLIILQWYIVGVDKQFNLLIVVLSAVSLLCSYFVYTFILLKIYRKANRALQTLTSLLISHLIVHVFVFPLLLVTPIVVTTHEGQLIFLLIRMIYLMLTLVLTIWQFLITTYIYKQALELDYLNAILASFGLLACNILTISFWQ